MRLCYRVLHFIAETLIDTTYASYDDQRLAEIVRARPDHSFVIEVNEFNAETKRYTSDWQRFYTISQETLFNSPGYVS